MKRPRGKLKGKRQRESGERAQTTLVELLALIDAAADDTEINSIVVRLSLGKRAIFVLSLAVYGATIARA